MNKQQKTFIAGTDTDVGKTLVTCALIQFAKQKRKTVIALKPVAAGCESADGQLKNDDALKLMENLPEQHDYHLINSIALEPAIAPNIAAKKINFDLSINKLKENIDLNQFDHEVILVEGAGGWLVPLNEKETLADWVEQEDLNVILVVGMKLGCINHALLTIENIKKRGLTVVGWVANCIDQDMSHLEENIETLKNMISEPLLAKIPYLKNKNVAHQFFSDRLF